MSGSITFSNISSTIRNPGVYAEIIGGNSVQPNLQTLLIGQMLPTGTAAVNEPVFAGSANDARTLAGAGSMLDAMCQQYFGSDNTGTVYLLPLADDPAAVKASASLTINGTSTSNGTVALYLGGQRYAVGVATGTTAASIVASLMAAFPTQVQYFTASVSGDVITVQPKNAGLVGNGFDVRVNAGGTLAGEVLPNGITVTVSASTGGEVNPVTGLTTALANLQDSPFEFFIHPYTDTASLSVLTPFLDDHTGRWSPTRKLFGGAYTAALGNTATLLTLGEALNDAHTSILGYFDMPTTPWIVAAEYGAQCAVSLRANAPTPIINLALNLPAAPIPSRFNFAERNSLLNGGISTIDVNQSGPFISRGITTYQTNPEGIPDDSFLDVSEMENIAFITRFIVGDLATTFARKVLGADGSIIAGPNVVTPTLIKTHLVCLYQELEANGNVTNSGAFAKACAVQNAGGGRVNLYAPIETVTGLYVIAILEQITSF